MCLIVLETKGLSFQSTAFHPLGWNTVSYCSQRKQAAICKKNLFTDFWVTWLFHGSSSPHFLWEQIQIKPFFYVDVGWYTALNTLLPGQQLCSFFLAPHPSQDAEGIHISRTWWEVFRMQKSCLILPESHFGKHWNLLPRGAPQLPDLCGLMAAKNLLQQFQLWILTASGCLWLCSDRTEPPGRSHWTPQPPSWPTVRRFLWLLSPALIFLKRQKTAALGGLSPPVPSCLWRSAGRQSPLDPVTCEFTSTALKACPAAGSTTGYSCVGVKDSFTEWGVTSYFLIWINYVHRFFSPQFLSRLTERPGSQNGCDQIKLSKATVSTGTGAHSAQFVQYDPQSSFSISYQIGFDCFWQPKILQVHSYSWNFIA